VSALVDRMDRAVGLGIERAVSAHHRRRLRRQGWERALSAAPGSRWASGHPPPRQGNSLDLIIDGAEVLPQIARALESAGSYVHVAGWHVAPDFALARDGGRRTVRELLSELSREIDVRVLLWAGAPLPLFRPSRSEARGARDALCRGTAVRCALDSRERPLHCHHEKLVIIDGEVAFVGGLDLTDFAGDRFDSPLHADGGGIGWHDVAARLRGPAVADLAAHFAMRWQEVTGESAPANSTNDAGEVEVQVVRTVPEGIYRSTPRGDFRIAEAYLRALRSAERLIYLENQFLWSPEIVAVLVDKLRSPPCDEFRVVILLPAKPNDGADDTRGQLAALLDADRDHDRLLACTIYSGSGTGPPVYVHAKVAIVDDEWLTVGSANLNEHSLFNDSEVNLVTRDDRIARDTRERLWAEHLELESEDLEGDPRELVDRLWKPICAEQLERRRAGAPMTHRLCLLPSVSRRSARLRGPLTSLIVDG
jgi:phosphatidylserine/phosphatidylglycerophosphate/cardiolipin synthase-like enzyme